MENIKLLKSENTGMWKTNSRLLVRERKKEREAKKERNKEKNREMERGKRKIGKVGEKGAMEVRKEGEVGREETHTRKFF